MLGLYRENGNYRDYRDYMVVSQNKGTPIWTPKYYGPYYRDPQNGTLNFGKPPYRGVGLRNSGLGAAEDRRIHAKGGIQWPGKIPIKWSP